MSHRSIYIFLAVTAACVLGGVQLISLYVPGTWPVFTGGVVTLALLASSLWLMEKRPVLMERLLFLASILMALGYSFAAYRTVTYPQLFFNAAKAYEGAMTLAIVSWVMVAIGLLSLLWRNPLTQAKSRFAA